MDVLTEMRGETALFTPQRDSTTPFEGEKQEGEAQRDREERWRGAGKQVGGGGGGGTASRRKPASACVRQNGCCSSISRA